LLSSSPYARPFFANELAPALSQTVFDSDGNSTDFNGWMCGDDFVDTMWFPAWVMLRAIDLIAKPGNGDAVNGVQWGAANDFSTMIRRVAYDDNFSGHVEILPIFHQHRLSGLSL
jgi:hypothetical protein